MEAGEDALPNVLLWEFDDQGLMRVRFACINDLPTKESDRRDHWPLDRRPDDHLRVERSRSLNI
jgi:nuclear transport factor 2 (NTF2) superfamily protein